MAKDSSGLIIVLGGAAVAWYGYTQGWFSSFFAPAAVIPLPASTPTPTCPAPNVVINGVCTAPAVTQGTNPPVAQATTPPAPSTSGMTQAAGIAALTLAAQAASEGLPNAATATLNADQWNYYYGHVPAFNTPKVNGASVTVPQTFDFGQVFFPNGRPASPASYTQYTAAQFIAALQQSGMTQWGLSGFGNVGYRRIPVPTMVRPAYGRGMGQYTLADLRRAGRH